MYRTIFDDLYRLNREMNRLFTGSGKYSYSTYWPEINLYENQSEYVAVVNIPGVEKDKIAISYKDNSLKISGEKGSEKETSANYYLKERKTGKFERNIMFQEKVEADKIGAEMKNGFLLVKIPKSPEAKPVTIAIK